MFRSATRIASNKFFAGASITAGFIAGGAFLATPIYSDAPKASAAGVSGGIERTFIAIKPDGTQRGLVGEVICRFERKGYKLIAIKILSPKLGNCANKDTC
jgi:nucleoside-diphosphate kinase